VFVRENIVFAACAARASPAHPAHMTVPLPLRRIFALGLVIAGGVFLRGYGHGFGVPAFWVKFGGSALWAAAWFFFFALLLRERPRENVLYVAALVCALIEFAKLVHTPALDVFRMTTTGAWTMGRVFSPWNLLAYGAGLAAAYGLDKLLTPADAPRVKNAKNRKSGRRRRR
jgi:hypothetical protein